MALISKMNRCAVCGSSEVVYNEAAGLYHCPVCGKDSAEPMPQADLAITETSTAMIIAPILFSCDANGEMDELRRRYPRLDLPTWSKEDRLQL